MVYYLKIKLYLACGTKSTTIFWVKLCLSKSSFSVGDAPMVPCINLQRERIVIDNTDRLCYPSRENMNGSVTFCRIAFSVVL